MEEYLSRNNYKDKISHALSLSLFPTVYLDIELVEDHTDEHGEDDKDKISHALSLSFLLSTLI